MPPHCGQCGLNEHEHALLKLKDASNIDMEEISQSIELSLNKTKQQDGLKKDDVPTEEQAAEDSKTSDNTSKPWHKRRYARLFAFRIFVRLCVMTTLILVFRYTGIPWQSWLDSYNDWIASLGFVGGPLAFLACATLFSSLSPTGYLPTLLAGATFDLWQTILIAYFSVNIGAIVNVGLVRKALRPCAQRYFRRRLEGFSGIDRVLRINPVKMVILLRLPYLGSGFLNYLFSMSQIDLAPYIMSNAIGFIPGSVLFSLLGDTARSLLQAIAQGNPGTTELIVISLTIGSCIIAILGIAVLVRRFTAKERSAKLESTASNDESDSDNESADHSVEKRRDSLGDTIKHKSIEVELAVIDANTDVEERVEESLCTFEDALQDNRVALAV